MIPAQPGSIHGQTPWRVDNDSKAPYREPLKERSSAEGRGHRELDVLDPEREKSVDRCTLSQADLQAAITEFLELVKAQIENANEDTTKQETTDKEATTQEMDKWAIVGPESLLASGT